MQSPFVKLCLGVFFVIVVSLLLGVSTPLVAVSLSGVTLQPAKVSFHQAPCVARGTSEGTVGGLRVAVPKLPQSLRLSYMDGGNSQYTVRAAERQVLNYYLPKLAASCWSLVALQPAEAIWQNDASLLRLAVQEYALGNKSVVTYAEAGGGRVLGATVQLAQVACPSGQTYCPGPNGAAGGCYNDTSCPTPPTTNTDQPPSFYGPANCPAGQLLCPGMNGSQTNYCYPGTTCPSSTSPAMPGANFPGQMPPTPTCPANQFSCNGTCTDIGKSCNGYPSYMPGSSMPQCGSDSFYCMSKAQCMKMGENMACPPPAGMNNMMPGTTGTTNIPPGTVPTTNQPMGNIPFPGDNKTGMGQPGVMGQGPPGDMGMQMDAQRFEQMKLGLSQFGKGIKQMNAMVVRLQKQLGGAVGIPPELTAALAKAPEALAKIKNAQSPDELEEIMGDVQDIGSTMQDWGPKLGELMRLAQMLKQANREAQNVQRAVRRAESALKRNADLAEAVKTLKDQAAQLTAALGDAKTLAQTDPEAALDKLDDDFYGNMEEFFNQVSFVDMMRNLKKGLSQAASQVRQAENTINRLSRAGKLDEATTSDLKTAIDDLKAQVDEVKKLSQAKPIDQDAIRQAGEDLWQQLSDVQNQLAEHGASFYAPQIKSGPSVQFELPQGYSGPTQSGEFGGEQGPVGTQGTTPAAGL